MPEVNLLKNINIDKIIASCIYDFTQSYAFYQFSSLNLCYRRAYRISNNQQIK